MCVWPFRFLHLGFFIIWSHFVVNQLLLGSQGGKPNLWWIVSSDSLKTLHVDRKLSSHLSLDRWQKRWILNGNDTTYGITWPNLQEHCQSAAASAENSAGIPSLTDLLCSLCQQLKFSRIWWKPFVFLIGDRAAELWSSLHSIIFANGFSIISAMSLHLDCCPLSSSDWTYGRSDVCHSKSAGPCREPNGFGSLRTHVQLPEPVNYS